MLHSPTDIGCCCGFSVHHRSQKQCFSKTLDTSWKQAFRGSHLPNGRAVKADIAQFGVRGGSCPSIWGHYLFHIQGSLDLSFFTRVPEEKMKNEYLPWGSP